MGDAKVKQPFFGTQAHHHHHHHHHHHNHNHAAPAESSLVTPTTTHSNGVTMSAAVIDAKHATSTGLLTGGLNSKQTVGPGAGKDAAGIMANPSKSAGAAKYEQLKQRKQELQKRLNEKYSQLQQIKREEAQLIGMYPSDFSCGIGPSDGPAGTAAGGNGAMSNGTAPTLRRKIGTSFKLPENLLNNKEDDINKLLLEKQIQQQISEASLRLANDGGQPKSVRRTHKQNYEQAQQKLLAINQNLSALKKRQQQQQQQQHQQQQQQSQQAAAEHKPSARDDIDLHKSAQVNRFRSNSNSSSMLMHLSERRNSVKSTGSSNASGSIAAQHHQHAQHHQQQQQQMLQVQIPPGHYHHSPQLQHHPPMQHKQQISPYSIHSGIIPSGSQSMTSAASAAMISQLSMLRHRARTDSFSGIVSYDSLSAGSAAELSVKMSPISANGSIASGGSIGQLQHHHHHQQQQQQPQPQMTVGPGPSRMNRLIQQQLGVNYSPPPGVVVGGGNGTTGYVLSPTVAVGSPSGNGGQAFVYDTKVIARLQGTVNSNMHHFSSPPSHPQQLPLGSTVGTGPHGYGHHLLSDQNLCPNAMAAPTGGGYDQGISDHRASGSVGTPAGLGGYWMTLESGEKVWCSVDSRQFSSLDRKQGAGAGGSMKLSRTSTKLTSKPTGQLQPAVKSSSLGNFQEYIGKSGSLTQDDDMISVQPDAISVTSGSSEHKKREKVWRETSLDSPLLKHKTLPPLPPGPPHAVGTLPVNGHLLQSPGAISPNSPSYHHHHVATNNPTIPLHINTNVSSYTSSSPLLLSPQQMRYYQQRQQQLLEQQRQRMKQQQQQQQRVMIEEQQKQMQSASSRQDQQHPVQHPNNPTVGSLQPPLPMSAMNATSTASLTTTTLEHYNALHYQQHKPQNPPPYHSRHQHPPPPPLPPPNQHHYHHSQQRLQHPPPPPPPPPLVHPQHLDLLPPSSYTQHDGVPSSTHLSPSATSGGGSRVVSHHLDGGTGYGYHSGGTLSSRHPDLLISPTLSHASSHTLTSPTTIVQALPIGRAGGDETSNVSPTPSAVMTHQPAVTGPQYTGAGGPKSDIQMESPKNMTVVQQGKIMPYKEVTKPFEMSDFYKYSTKYRQKQQQQQQQPPHQARPDQYQGSVEEQSLGQQQEADGDGGSGEGIHKGIYQPPNRSICQPINNYN